jgi:hypothetical protein
VVELGLDRGEVREDVRVVVLEVGEHRGARPVPHELRALVEEAVSYSSASITKKGESVESAETWKLRAMPPIRNPGLEPAVGEDPREHRGDGALAVRAGHRQHPLVDEDVLREPLRARERRAGPWSRIASMTGLPRVIALPTT